MSRKDGGPAFPRTWKTIPTSGTHQREIYEDGMTLRDYFAAHATDADVEHYINAYGCRRESAKYRYADDMLSQRDKE